MNEFIKFFFTSFDYQSVFWLFFIIILFGRMLNLFEQGHFFFIFLEKYNAKL